MSHVSVCALGSTAAVGVFREAVIYFSGQPCDEKETTGHCALTSLIRESECECVCVRSVMR